MGVRVVSRSKQEELDVSPEEALAGLESGDLALVDSHVHVRREGNRTGRVSAGELGRALAEGWKISDADTNSKAKLRREEDTAAGLAIGIGEQALSGATLGLSSLAAEKLGADPARMAARAEATGGAGTAAQIAGLIVPGVLTGGGSAAAGGAARAGLAARVAGALPAGAAVRAGRAVEHGVAKLIGTGETASALGRAARVAVPNAAGQAVEGFAFGLGTELHESVLGQRELSAERVLAAGLMNAALGGGLGLAMPGVTKIAAGVARAPARAVETVMRRFTGEAVESLASKPGKLATAMSVATGAPRELVEEGLGLLKTREGRRFATMGKIEHADAIEGLGQQIIKTVDSTNDAIGTALQKTEGREYMRGIALPRNADLVAPRVTNTVLSRAEANLDTVAAKAERYADGDSRAMLDEARELLRGGRATLEDASSSAAETMRRTDQIVRQLSSIEQRARKARMAGFVADDAVEAVRTARKELSTHLENEQLWGDAGRLQKEGNALQHAALKARRDLPGKRSAAQRLLDRNEVSTTKDAIAAARQFGRSGPGSMEEGLDSVLQKEVDYLEWVGRNREMPDDFHTAVTAAKSQLDDLRRFSATNRERLDAAEVMSRLRGYESGDSVSIGTASNMGTGVGALVGGAIAGPLGAGIGAFAGRAISSPYTAIRTMAGLLNMAERTGLKVDGAVGKFLHTARGGSTARALPAASGASSKRSGSLTGAAVVAASVPTQEERRERALKIRERATYLATTPGAIAEELEFTLLAARDVAPGVANTIIDKAQRAAMFLQQRLPTGYKPPFGNQPRIVDPIDAAKFERYVETVENPTAVLDKLADGTLTSDHAEALREVYPAIYADVQSSIIDELADAQAEGRDLPFSARMTIGTLFDVVTDISMEPSVFAELQALWAGTGMEQPMQQPPSRVSTAAKDVGLSLSTPAQRIEGGQSKWA